MRSSVWPLFLALTTPLFAQRGPDLPVCAAEASGFTRTSTLADVQAFLTALDKLPTGRKLEVSTFGKTVEDRDMLLVHVARTAQPNDAAKPDDTAQPEGASPLRVLVVADIHGGEVCGKEAMQILLREIVRGEHDEWLADCDLWVVPIYNVDGNERIARDHRANVNGPVEGLGARENADGLDLNRDCIKVRSPEFRALLGLFDRLDPHVLFDLHTTNGSPHGYHLTYASSLATNIDPTLDAYARQQLLPQVRSRVLERHGYRVFDFGDFSRNQPPTFATFDHRPRFLTNYYGLRNRLSLLSEAFAYDPFEIRVRSTRAFVLESIRVLVADRERVTALCDAADRRATVPTEPIAFGWDTTLIDGEETDVLMGSWDTAPIEGRGRTMMRRSDLVVQRMRVQNAFVSRKHAMLPEGGWALLEPSDTILDVLRAHGIALEQTAAARDAQVEQFVPRSGDRAARPFQGIRTIELRGDWQSRSRSLPAGTWIVSSRQPHARIAAQLLEPESEDGFVTWAFFEDRTTFAVSDQDIGSFPVLRLR